MPMGFSLITKSKTAFITPNNREGPLRIQNSQNFPVDHLIGPLLRKIGFCPQSAEKSDMGKIHHLFYK